MVVMLLVLLLVAEVAAGALVAAVVVLAVTAVVVVVAVAAVVAVVAVGSRDEDASKARCLALWCHSRGHRRLGRGSSCGKGSWRRMKAVRGPLSTLQAYCTCCTT